MKHIKIFLLFSAYIINASDKNKPIDFKKIKQNTKITAALHDIENLCLGLGL